MSAREKTQAVNIPPGRYPVLCGADAAALLRALRDPVVAERVASAFAERLQDMREAVLHHVRRMDAAMRRADLAAVFDEAHEIRGLAGNAGLSATGRIANGLCRYLDALTQLRAGADPALVALHMDAIARTAHAEDEATRLGEEVAGQLAALVSKRLAEIND